MSRDIEALRQRYVEHKQQLERLASDSPTEALALRYRQVSAEIEAAIAKLDELEQGLEAGGAASAAAASAAAAASGPRADDAPFRRTSPGTRPLRNDSTPVVPVENTGARTILILAVGILVLALLGFFLWRFATGDDEGETTTTATTTAAATETEAAAPRSILTVEPLTQDYGTVQRGSRATRQFELLNSTDAAMTIRAQRSQCRCLWFEYADTIPPQGSTTMTVTVDASKVKEGTLHETVQVVSKTDPSVTATFEVVAEVR